MSALQRLQAIRGWVPVPDKTWRPRLWRWIMLDGNRLAVTGALLTVVFVSILVIGTFWSFEMAVLLTETSTVEQILTTFLSGIILLVSVVVSINSIFLSQDMTSVDQQRSRVEGVNEFWQRMHTLSDTPETPSNLRNFLELITCIIEENLEQIADSADQFEEEQHILAFTEETTQILDRLEWDTTATATNFSLLWVALKIAYGPLLDEARLLRHRATESDPEAYKQSLESIIEALQLFAVGRGYFKTMYYTTEVSRFSRILLIVSLPAIIITSSAILAISASLLPEYWILGLPPLHSFVAATFTIALLPYIVLTSFVLRLSKVARLTNAEGLVSMR